MPQTIIHFSDFFRTARLLTQTNQQRPTLERILFNAPNLEIAQTLFNETIGGTNPFEPHKNEQDMIMTTKAVPVFNKICLFKPSPDNESPCVLHSTHTSIPEDVKKHLIERDNQFEYIEGIAVPVSELNVPPEIIYPHFFEASTAPNELSLFNAPDLDTVKTYLHETLKCHTTPKVFALADNIDKITGSYFSAFHVISARQQMDAFRFNLGASSPMCSPQLQQNLLSIAQGKTKINSSTCLRNHHL